VLPTTIFQEKRLSISTSIAQVFNTTKLICIRSGDAPSFQAFLPKFEPSFGGGDFGGHIFVAPQIYYSQILPKFKFGKKRSNASLRI
jgi:hypothetical protein